ncbi:MAG: metal-dependent hydrolase [Nannocystaceae bacterium]
MAITIRTMRFELPEELDPLLIPGEPEESYLLAGLSLVLPYLEPYLIRTMNAAKGRLRDPTLVEELRRFNAQEGQHFRAHRRFNEALREHNPGFAALVPLEAAIEADYQRFTAERSLRFNLAYAEGFEAMTTATALYLLELRREREIPAALADLMYWHAIEELEHRTVAFDVYEAVAGGYLYRLAVGLYAQLHLLRFAVRVARVMLRVDRERVAALGGARGRRRRLRRQLARVARRLAPKVLRTYMPWYSPRKIDFTPEMAEVAAHYTAKAASAR